MQKKQLNDPILIAAWPGMGHVAASACYYLISKLEMELYAEYATSDLFDVDYVTIDSGLVQPFRYPRNQFFAWKNPNGGSDLLVFIREAQPPLGLYNYCRKLIDYAQSEGVSKIFTFAALATSIGVDQESHVIGVATDKVVLQNFVENEVDLLAAGSISGMNGVLLGVAAERRIPGGCLLGEMPSVFVNVPYPKASLAVLKTLMRIIDTKVDYSELNLEVERVDQHLGDLLTHLRRLEQESESELSDEDEDFIPDPMEMENISPEDREHLDQLFEIAKSDRSKAYELKRELDRLDVFGEYEDRFLDLFKKEE